MKKENNVTLYMYLETENIHSLLKIIKHTETPIGDFLKEKTRWKRRN